jgi:mannose PTS system EIIA component
MVPVLVLTHGKLADELLVAARNIDPHLGDASVALSLPWDVDFDQSGRQLKQALRGLDQGAGVLILTDMFGGTATNLALPFVVPEKIEVVTGVNLPMLVKLGSLRDQGLSLHDLALRLTEAGQKSIRVASEFLRQRSAS